MGTCILSNALLVAKNGSVDALIPLYAVGVFLAFTLSQTSMVIHWFKVKGDGWQRKVVINGIGAVATGIVLMDIAVEKFMDGAWIVLVILALMVFLFRSINTHYRLIGAQLKLPSTFKLDPPKGHKIFVFVSGLHKGIVPAIDYGRSLSKDCTAVYVEIDAAGGEKFRAQWETWGSGVPLVILNSPYRSVVRPITKYLDSVVAEYKNDSITVIIPEIVTKKSWHALLHGQTGLRLKLALLSRKGIVVSNVRYYLSR